VFCAQDVTGFPKSKRGEAMKEFKLRFSTEVPETSSETVSAWLDEALRTKGSLASDPGGGDAFVNVTVDEAKVAELANRHGAKSNVVLRRLIASNVSLAAVESPKKKSAGAVMAEVLPGKVLPKRLEYKDADMLPLVRGLDSGMALLYRQIYGLEDLTAAQTPEADRELASAMAECLNRRSPEWLLANADLMKLTFAGVRWSFEQTAELDKQIAAAKEKARKKAGGANAASGASPSGLTVDELNQNIGTGVEFEGSR
jgi:hypothetical protein